MKENSMKPWQPKEIRRFNYVDYPKTRNPIDNIGNAILILDVQDRILVKILLVLNEFYYIEIMFDQPIAVVHEGRAALNLRFENTHLNREVMKFSELKWRTNQFQLVDSEFDFTALSFFTIENHDYDDYLESHHKGLLVYDFYFYVENITVIVTSPFYPKLSVREGDLYAPYAAKFIRDAM